MNTTRERLRVRHFAKSRAYGNSTDRHIQCDTDQQPWPCDVAQLLDHLEALERRVRAAEEALREVLALWDDDVPDPDDVERDVLVPARAALSALSALSEARSLITEGQK